VVNLIFVVELTVNQSSSWDADEHLKLQTRGFLYLFIDVKLEGGDLVFSLQVDVEVVEVVHLEHFGHGAGDEKALAGVSALLVQNEVSLELVMLVVLDNLGQTCVGQHVVIQNVRLFAVVLAKLLVNRGVALRLLLVEKELAQLGSMQVPEVLLQVKSDLGHVLGLVEHVVPELKAIGESVLILVLEDSGLARLAVSDGEAE
jgi:hypothetical protein